MIQANLTYVRSTEMIQDNLTDVRSTEIVQAIIWLMSEMIQAE